MHADELQQWNNKKCEGILTDVEDIVFKTISSANNIFNFVHKLKNNRAPGTDGLPAELFKAGGHVLIILELIMQISEDETISSERTEGIVVPV